MSEVKTLTVKEALEQGYEHYVVDNEENGCLRDIVDFEDDDSDESFVLAEKEYLHPFGLSNEEIQNVLADIISDNYYLETGLDTDEVYNLIKSIDFSGISERIDEALKKVKYKQATKIRLVP